LSAASFVPSMSMKSSSWVCLWVCPCLRPSPTHTRPDSRHLFGWEASARCCRDSTTLKLGPAAETNGCHNINWCSIQINVEMHYPEPYESIELRTLVKATCLNALQVSNLRLTTSPGTSLMFWSAVWSFCQMNTINPAWHQIVKHGSHNQGEHCPHTQLQGGGGVNRRRVLLFRDVEAGTFLCRMSLFLSAGMCRRFPV
jgi:hypothetical protein